MTDWWLIGAFVYLAAITVLLAGTIYFATKAHRIRMSTRKKMIDFIDGSHR